MALEIYYLDKIECLVTPMHASTSFHHSSPISSIHHPKHEYWILNLAMQHFIMLMHKQMQQIDYELAPPICVLKKKF